MCLDTACRVIVERLGQLVDRGRATAEPGDDPATYRVGQGREGTVQPHLVRLGSPHIQLLPLINEYVEYREWSAIRQPPADR